ncbi:hypothetical protein A1O7_01176 [Cladophialophora yegresii CBS 114405]|uniref:Uncharacterized protein n=1 Tax=Cladophialophora yegresii CBS 114405 TaxID=1182544 RepID=W9WA84_9EURO|nr:uncharacterized protein A1O7_01176 [Cladophialophora yegresii CBS 114405]EXJ64838.1 hypothetical protein A1O7_01176 [Cladophialophora yegresii CBS 114405]
MAKLSINGYEQRSAIKDPLSRPDTSSAYGLGSARSLPTTPAEASWDRKRNAFEDPNSARIPREDILAIYPSEKAWRTVYMGALSNNAFARRVLMTYILFHSAIKNTEIHDVLNRGKQLLTGQWPYTAVPPEVKQNYFDWLNWLACLDETIPNALKHHTWMVLLEREYATAEPVWTRFWDLDRELNRAESRCELREEMDDIEIKMAAHNRKRHFLQRALIAGKDWVLRTYLPPPMWVDWSQVVQDIVAAGLQDGMDDRFHSDETQVGYESGHISDPEATETEEEFEL